MYQTNGQLYDDEGARKYLTDEEFQRLIAFSARLAADRRAFTRLVAYTGCRISEGLALRRSGVCLGSIILPTLKRRRRLFRRVPVPDALIADLQAVPINPDHPDLVWKVNRSTAYRWVQFAMQAVRIEGIHACPRGLRHAFGVRGGTRKIPQGKLQQLFGHALPTTTAIYMDAVDEELRAMVARTW